MKVCFSGIMGTDANDLLATYEMPGVPREGEQVEMADGLIVLVKAVCWTPFNNFDCDVIVRVA